MRRPVRESHFNMGLIFIGVIQLLIAGVLIYMVLFESGYNRTQLIVMSSLLVSTGLAAVLYRSGFSIDRGRGLVVRWWGIAFPIVRKERMLREFSQVLLTCERHYGVTPSHVFFFIIIWLAGPGGMVKLKEFTSDDIESARYLAQRISALAGRPVTDASSQFLEQ